MNNKEYLKQFGVKIEPIKGKSITVVHQKNKSHHVYYKAHYSLHILAAIEWLKDELPKHYNGVMCDRMNILIDEAFKDEQQDE